MPGFHPQSVMLRCKFWLSIGILLIVLGVVRNVRAEVNGGHRQDDSTFDDFLHNVESEQAAEAGLSMEDKSSKAQTSEIAAGEEKKNVLDNFMHDGNGDDLLQTAGDSKIPLQNTPDIVKSTDGMPKKSEEVFDAADLKRLAEFVKDLSPDKLKDVASEVGLKPEELMKMVMEAVTDIETNRVKLKLDGAKSITLPGQRPDRETATSAENWEAAHTTMATPVDELNVEKTKKINFYDDDDFMEKERAEDGDFIVYVNEFAVELEGDLQEAELIASIYGFKVKKIRFLKGVYLFTHPSTPRRSKRSADDVMKRLQDDPHVHFVEQQKHLHREKRRGVRQENRRYVQDVREAYREVREEIRRRGRLDKRTIGDERPDYNDPQFTRQWYLTSTAHVTRSASAGLDLNVAPVWASGYTGDGVVLSVLDDGLQHNHSDIERNYDPRASYDLNDDDPDPTPNFKVDGNDHGTMCSGEIAAVADNSRCGIGVAYNSKIGAVRMLDGVITDVLEGSGLGFGIGHIDIYSASWGPADDGTKMQAPGHFAMAALLRGIHEGRGGKGSIYVWASGNGGVKGDSGNADGYVSSIYTIAIGSLDADGESNYYNEPASSIMAMAVTGGRKAHGQPGPPGNVVTTGWHDRCVVTFGGTSAAAPLMAGCLALVLEANPDLTWRDVQHVIVEGARLVMPDETRWTINGAGHHVSHDFGFGMADCGLMVGLAQNWTNVHKQHTCKVPDARIIVTLPPSSSVTLNLTTDGCANTSDKITRLEHVEVKVIITHPVRGELQLDLISPSGTRSTVMRTRSRDKATTGINFKFMSVHFWGEDPTGTWVLEVSDKPDYGSGHMGQVTYFSLILYGTSGAEATTHNSTNEGRDQVRRSVTTKQLQEIHEREIQKSRKISIRQKRNQVKKRKSDRFKEGHERPMEGHESFTKNPKIDEDAKPYEMSDEEKSIVKRILDELEKTDNSY